MVCRPISKLKQASKQASKAELSRGKRKEAKLTSQVSKNLVFQNTDSGGGKGAEISRQNKTHDWDTATITLPQDRVLPKFW